MPTNHKHIKPLAVVFDFGGTLDTNGVHWSEKYWDGYCAAGVRLEKKIYEKAYVYAGEQMLGDIVTNEFTFRQTLEAQIMIQLHWLTENHHVDPAFTQIYKEQVLEYCYNGVKQTIARVKPLLDHISSHCPVALVSNFYGNVDRVLAEVGIDHYFTHIIDSEIVGIRKPDPEIFRIAVRRLGLPASEIVVIGDSYERDVSPAHEAGCRTVWLKGRSWKPHSDSEVADFVILDILELNNIIVF